MKPTEKPLDMEFTGVLRQFNAEVFRSKYGYVLKLHCLCDGTMIFQAQMIDILKSVQVGEDVGCASITLQTSDRPDLAPKNKPWMSCLFEAWGILPPSFTSVLSKIDIEQTE